jgi:hypothetical protein
MASNWMKAAGQEGIPTAFIINKDGKVAWIGHPMEMEKPLSAILDGTYDLQAAATKFKEDMAIKRKLTALRPKLQNAQGDAKAILAVCDEAIADEPKLELQLGMLKFTTLAGDPEMKDKTLEYGKHLVEKVYAENAQALNNLAWTLIEPKEDKKPDAKVAKLALAAAQRADSLVKSKEVQIADTLALAYFETGDIAKAVETQERALKLAKGTGLENDPGMKERMEKYRKALQK